jgi:hypothetical protein
LLKLFQVRHRIEKLFEFLKCAFGLVRSTHRAAYVLPIHLWVCLLAYSLYKQLIAQDFLPGIASVGQARGLHHKH